MIRFKARIERFGEQGEKTGWTYIRIPFDWAEKLNPGIKKSYRVKGKIEHYAFTRLSLMPMGGGDFIMTLNAAARKALQLPLGAEVKVSMELDHSQIKIPKAFTECLNDEPEARRKFEKLPPSHQTYYLNWINSAKTEPTQAKRIAATINAMLKGLDFGGMLRDMRSKSDF